VAWTRILPLHSGYYWYRDEIDLSAMQIVEVDLIFPRTGKPAILFSGDGVAVAPEELTGEYWIPQILPPIEKSN
jgi:hypothetical protein